jgi:beta-lactamase regulating signal transducer with metallopeptidase domain
VDVILNWLWQGIVIALVTAGLLRAIPQWRTQERSAVAWAGCIALLFLPAVPLLSALISSAASVDAPLSPPPVVVPQAWWTSPAAALTWWTVWAAACTFRTARAMRALRAAKRRSVPLPPALEVQLRHWRRVRSGGRQSPLVLSPVVATAGVLGGRTPVIAVAPSLLDTLEADDLDRVVIHEWAHVQRFDDAAHALLMLMRAVVGWHPGFWWLERQLRIEREVACDEMAVAVTGGAKAYATCLTTLAALLSERSNAAALAAVSSSGLRQRVSRILATRPGRVKASGATTAAAAVGVTMLTVCVGQFQVVGAWAAAVSPVAIAEALVAELPPVAATLDETVTPPGINPPLALQSASTEPAPAEHGNETIAEPAGSAVLSSLLSTTALAMTHFEPAPVVSQQWSARASAPVSMTPAPTAEPRLWRTAAEGGKAIGDRSEQAAIATAGFFTRFGKRLARSF